VYQRFAAPCPATVGAHVRRRLQGNKEQQNHVYFHGADARVRGRAKSFAGAAVPNRRHGRNRISGVSRSPIAVLMHRRFCLRSSGRERIIRSRQASPTSHTSRKSWARFV